MESKSVTVSPARPRRRPVIGRRLAVPLPRRRRPSAVRHVSAASRTSASAAGQRVCRKYRRSRFDVRRLQQREYDKLRRIVPALRVPDSAEKMRPRRVSKVNSQRAASMLQQQQQAHVNVWTSFTSDHNHNWETGQHRLCTKPAKTQKCSFSPSTLKTLCKSVTSFYSRDAYGSIARYMLRQRGWLAGWVSVTRRYCIKTAKPIFKLSRQSGSAIILVSYDPCTDTQFQGEPLQRGLFKYTGELAIFGGNCRLSRKWWLLRNVNRKSWVPDWMVSFSMTLSDP